MKYIVLQTSNGLELPLVFPGHIQHRDFYLRVQAMPELRGSVVVAGGFVAIGERGPLCRGESVSLDVKSRGPIDDKLITDTF